MSGSDPNQKKLLIFKCFLTMQLPPISLPLSGSRSSIMILTQAKALSHHTEQKVLTAPEKCLAIINSKWMKLNFLIMQGFYIRDESINLVYKAAIGQLFLLNEVCTRPQLMEMPSRARSPVAPVRLSRSDPARSTKWNFAVRVSYSAWVSVIEPSASPFTSAPTDPFAFK